MAKQDLENLRKLAVKTKSYVDTNISSVSASIEDETSARKSVDATLQTNIDSIKTKVSGLNYSGTGAKGKTITSITQTDGKLSSTFEDILIEEAQVSGLATSLSTLSNAVVSETTNRVAGDTSTLASAKSYTDTQVSPIKTEVDAINAKIPSQASSTNQLADKDFVNSSIATATATFRGTVESASALKALKGDENDYAFLKTTDSKGNVLFNRYKYSTNSSTSTTTGNWEYEYTLNNSSFTEAQWETINSGATKAVVAQVSTNKTTIDSHTSNKSNPHGVTKAQVGLSDVANTGDSATPTQNGTTKFTTGGAYALKTSLETSINAVSAKIDALDMAEITPSAGETISSIKQVDGKTYVSKQTISISQNQISDSATSDEVIEMLSEVFD